MKKNIWILRDALIAFLLNALFVAINVDNATCATILIGGALITGIGYLAVVVLAVLYIAGAMIIDTITTRY